MFRKLLFKDLTFTDIHTLYSDPREAERFFFDLKWKDGFVCSKCGHTHCMTVIRKNGSLRTVYQCSHCGYQESVIAGTALEGTKAPLLSWILVMFVFVISKTGTSAKYISDLTGVSYHTTKFMLRKIGQAQKQDNETHAATDCNRAGCLFLWWKETRKAGLGSRRQRQCSCCSDQAVCLGRYKWR